MSEKTRSPITDIELFSKLSELFDSKYEATMYLAKKARNKQQELRYLITESEALTFALTDDIPKTVEKRIMIKSSSLREIEDILNYVEDKEVQNAARTSFRKSVEIDHLIYQYKKITNESKQARVRILTRIMFYKYKEDTRYA